MHIMAPTLDLQISLPWRRAQHLERHRLGISFEAPPSIMPIMAPTLDLQISIRAEPSIMSITIAASCLRPQSLAGNWRRAQQHGRHCRCVLFEAPESGRKAPASCPSQPPILTYRSQFLGAKPSSMSIIVSAFRWIPWRRAQHHEHHRLCIAFEAPESGRKALASCSSWPQHVSCKSQYPGAGLSIMSIIVFACRLRPQSLAGKQHHAHDGEGVQLTDLNTLAQGPAS